MFLFDLNYLILVMLPGLIISGIASLRVKATFNRYSKVTTSSGMTGAQAALQMLRAAGLERKIHIEKVDGFLSDHYDPRKKVVRLSTKVHDSNSIAAVGVACHEVGHALQDAKNYAPLVLRNVMVPTASIGSNLSYILILIGLFFSSLHLLAQVGLLLFVAVVLFQLVTLPVEFNASNRAKEIMPKLGIIGGPVETAGVNSVLGAAAITYVAALVTALLNLAYLAMLVFGRRD
jgi:Zn-dependent membrane protease YugP